MQQEIKITEEENTQIEDLFTRYSSYMGMLEYLSFSAMEVSDSPIFEKKWNEAADLWIQLDRAKHKIEAKYKPAGNWDHYEFDFDECKVIFSYGE